MIISLPPPAQNVPRNVSKVPYQDAVLIEPRRSVWKLNLAGWNSESKGVKKKPFSPLNISMTSKELGAAVSEVPSFRARQPGVATLVS